VGGLLLQDRSSPIPAEAGARGRLHQGVALRIHTVARPADSLVPCGSEPRHTVRNSTWLRTPSGWHLPATTDRDVGCSASSTPHHLSKTAFSAASDSSSKPARRFLLRPVFVIRAKPFVPFDTLLFLRHAFLLIQRRKSVPRHPLGSQSCVWHWRHPQSPNGDLRLLTTKNLNKTQTRTPQLQAVFQHLRNPHRSGGPPRPLLSKTPRRVLLACTSSPQARPIPCGAHGPRLCSAQTLAANGLALLPSNASSYFCSPRFPSPRPLARVFRPQPWKAHRTSTLSSPTR
jgi:hypothetical protein